MKSLRKWFWLGLFMLVLGGLLLLTAAPLNNPMARGSTFSRSPDGYGAWYAYMQQQGVTIERWQRPPEVLWQSESTSPITLLQVRPQWFEGVESEWYDWVGQGNTLILLGIRQPVTAAKFSTMQSSDHGAVSIDTRRRKGTLNEEKSLLGDRYGAVVWQTEIKSGSLIQATTPDLAANAYQDTPGNFAFLAELVTTAKGSVWVDEYLHGYADLQPEDEQATSSESWANYLAQTPLLLILVQAIALCLVLFWGHQRRGATVTLQQPVPNNSEAYITALAGVLRQAKSTGFVWEMVAKAELLHLQKTLGLGSVLVDEETLVDAWVQQTQGSPAELQQLLKQTKRRSPPGEKDLVNWLEKIQAIHQEHNSKYSKRQRAEGRRQKVKD